jgi:S-adenosylmethionine hydrolase
MRLLTLTTDYGHSDHYVGALKGTLITRIPNIQVVDIAHDVAKYNPDAAGFVLGNAFPFFPKGSVHFVDVGVLYGHDLIFYLVESEGHWFVFSNPNIGNKIFYEKQHQVWAFNLKANNPFSFFIDDKIIETIIWLVKTKEIEDLLGPPLATTPFDRFPLMPYRTGNMFIGYIDYVDHYGNLHTNVTEKHIKDFTDGKPFQIKFCGENIEIYDSLATIGPSLSAGIYNHLGKLCIIVKENNAFNMLYNNTHNQVQIILSEW